jgi:hypothetical protein
MKCQIAACKSNALTNRHVCEEHKGLCWKCKKATKIVNGSEFCAVHKREEEQKKQTLVTQAKQMEKSKEKAEAKAPLIEKKNEQKANAEKLKNEILSKCFRDWTSQVNHIVQQVKTYRSQYGNPNINAGSNTFKVNADTNKFDLNGTKTIKVETFGGSDNPIKLAIPSNTLKITPGDVAPKMKGYDTSFSSGIKFRIDGVFVHAS